MSNIYDEILNSSNIQSILEYYGIQVHKNKCTCPFHNDKNPSMSIHQNKGIAKCFACGAGGNAISFIQKYESEINHNQISIKEAMQKAIDIQHLNIVIPENKNVVLTEEQKRKKLLTDILKDAIKISENLLKVYYSPNKETLEYLNKRNISKSVIENFHIGYLPGPDEMTKELLKKYKVEDLMDVGLTIEINERYGSYIDVFNDRITIPIFDEFGNPVGFGGRRIYESMRPKYLNTKETEIFNKSKLLFNYHKAKFYAKNDEIIILEGYMDVVSAKEMKMDNVVAIMGTSLTKEHIDMIRKLNCEITLSLDNDEAGRKAMIRVIPELLKENFKVNVLDISKLGNYKDFGDLQLAKFSKEQIYQTKISAFTFLMQYKYIKNQDLTVETIHKVYNEMWKDKLIKDTKDVLNFKEFITNNTKYTSDEIDRIIKPIEVKVNNRVDRYKDVFFYHYILNLIKNYAVKHQDTILLKYIESGKLDSTVLMDSINNEQFLDDNGLSINIGSYIRDFLFNTEDYIKFKNDKSFLLENLLNNVKAFDSKGNVVNVSLTMEQKEIILKQYNESFDDSIKYQIENNPDEFEELFIANNSIQFERLFPKTYKDAFKEQALSRFRNYGVMEAVRYALAYSEDMKSALSRQFVNNDKYKTLLVFNNSQNILGLSPENIKSPNRTKEKTIEQINEENIEKSEEKVENPMSIFIRLPGTQQETSKGMYLPVDTENAVYIPRQLYQKMDNEQVKLIGSKGNQANMSEYNINPVEKTKKFLSRLTLEEFYHKYFNLYEIREEKEVMA